MKPQQHTTGRGQGKEWEVEHTAGAGAITWGQHFHCEAAAEPLWEVCSEKTGRKKLKALNLVILRDSQTCPGGGKDQPVLP